jgi:hypothetical protein
MIGDLISSDLELANADNEIVPLSVLLHATEALVVLFVPYCFGKNSMEILVEDVNNKIEFFYRKELRVICITR